MAFITNQISDYSSDGYIYTSVNTTGVSFAFTTSYQELTSIATLPFSLANITQDFAMTTDGRLKYTGIKTKIFFVDAFLNAVTSSINISIKLYINGSPVSGSESYAVGNTRIMITKFMVQMSTNDYVSVWAKRSVNASANINQIILSAGSANGS